MSTLTPVAKFSTHMSTQTEAFGTVDLLVFNGEPLKHGEPLVRQSDADRVIAEREISLRAEVERLRAELKDANKNIKSL